MVGFCNYFKGRNNGIFSQFRYEMREESVKDDIKNFI